MPYLDFNASTPVDPRVLEVVFDVLSHSPGNASSVQHRTGQAAAEAVEEARQGVAALVGAAPVEVILTSGASEALTVAILGSILGRGHRPVIVVGATEHNAVLAAAELAARLAGGEVRVAPVDRTGVLDLDALEALCGPEVGLVAAMHANNETGTIHPVREIAEVVHKRGAVYLCDVTQSAGKLPLDDIMHSADLATFSSHKIYGPKGAGALVASRRQQREMLPIFPGGGQERGLRGGTPDTPSIAGFGMAARLAKAELASDDAHARGLMEQLRNGLARRVPDLQLIGSECQRLGNTMNFRFPGADAEAVMASMPDVEVSTGSACQAAVPTVSHVLLAMGLTHGEASECLRISVGRPTTEAEIDIAVECLASAVKRVRSMTAA